MSHFKDYENKMQRLEDIIEQLNGDPDLTLEQSISLYSEGVRLHKQLQQILKEAEGSIVEIRQQDFQDQIQQNTNEEITEESMDYPSWDDDFDPPNGEESPMYEQLGFDPEWNPREGSDDENFDDDIIF